MHCTKQEVLDAISQQPFNWIALNKITIRTKFQPNKAQQELDSLLEKRLIIRKNSEYKLSKSGRHFYGILTKDEKLEIYVKEHKNTLWLILGIVGIGLTILTIALSC